MATLVLYLVRHEYIYAGSDQDDVLPFLLHLLDPTLFASDWFVAGQAESFGPRTLFVWFTYLPARLVGPAATYAALYVVSWCFTAAAVYVLSCRIAADRVAAAGTVVVVLLLTPRFTLGGNDLAIALLIPSVPAWALALWGLVACLRSRPLWAALLLGLATGLQALIGLQVAGTCMLLLIWQRKSIRGLVLFAAAYLLLALPALLPQVMQHWGASSGDPSLYHILFEYRAPHHYLLTRFDLFRSLAFAVLLAASLACFPLLKRAERSLPVQIMVIAGIGGLAGFVGTELMGSEFVGKLQLFKLSVLAKVMIVAVICHGVSRSLPEVVRAWFMWIDRRPDLALAGTLLMAALLLLTSPDALGFKRVPGAEEGEALHQIEAWARGHSAQESVFAVPPSWGGFRSRAHRAIAVSIKGFPFSVAGMHEWYGRMQAFAPRVGDEGSLWIRLPAMDSSFLALSWDEIYHLRERYGFDYVVRSVSESTVPAGMQPVFSAGEFAVYRLAPP